MISTMPKSGQVPSSPNAMPGGLGAILQQPGGNPKGASPRSIASIMDRARGMSDMQLADVLSGKSLDVPQYVAMTEAMGRKSLRTAMQGAQAQQQLNKPSVKDRLLAEEAQATQMAQAPQGGIDQLPTSNMGSVDMASGGIVAFQNRGVVEDEQTLKDREGAKEILTKMIAAGKDVFSLPGRALGGAYNTTNRGIRSLGFDTPYIPESYFAGDSSSMTPYMDALEKQKGAKKLTPEELDAIARGQGVYPEGSSALPNANLAGSPAQPRKDVPKKTGIAAVLDKEEEAPKKADDGYLSKLMGISEKTRAGIAGLKNETQSQVLLDAMSALMGNRNLAEAGSKFGQLAAGRVGAMGKESRGLEKEANEYDLNLAKYQEAIKSGDQDRALKLKELLENSKYQQGMLKYHMAMANKPDAGIAMLNALKNPANMDIYKEMFAAKKTPDIIPRATALKEYNDLLGDISNRNFKKRYPTFESYYNDLTGGSGGGGTPVKFLGFEK